MNNSQMKSWLRSRNLILMLLLIGLIYTVVTVIVNTRLQEIEIHTRTLISEQQALLATISEITARNGADSVTESVIKDCSFSERSQFDDLLGQLNKGLTHSKLVDLERLFGRCGSFYSERKSVMVARFAREIEIYEDYVNQLSIITDNDESEEFQVSKWNMLSKEEQDQGRLFAELVRHQDKIISTLIEGYTADSPEIASILQEVSVVQNSLIVSKKNSSDIRSELTSL